VAEDRTATALAAPRRAVAARERLIHVGCGVERLEGWVNVDYELFPSVDVVADMRDPLPFRGVRAVFAEHFLEHLTLAAGMAFLESAHAALQPGGWIRLTTPNLDWVWVTQYRLDTPPDQARANAQAMNRAFHAWGHRFLWNQSLLEEALAACGFDDVQPKPRGESDAAFLRGVERHEAYADYGPISHVIVLEARRGEARPKRLAAFRADLWNGFWSQVEARDRGPVGHDGVPLPRPAAGAAPSRGAAPPSPQPGVLAAVRRRLGF
jgi:predicted SAM-dependent methyltransferase